MASKASAMSQPKVTFKCTSHLKESHQNPIFGIAFSHYNPSEEPPVFATVGSNEATIYRCHPGGEMNLLQKYADPDKEENFYSCAWTYALDEDGGHTHLLCVAGERGVIRVINTFRHLCERSLLGHGNSVNDLRVHPRNVLLLLSASKDHSLRLWNAKTGACIAVLGGVDGHRDEVLSGDFDIRGRFVVSGGMDHSVKVWDIDRQDIIDAAADLNTNPSFSSVVIHFPCFGTRTVHRNYVDCVRCLGQLLLTKSCENAIVLWKPPGVGVAADSGSKLESSTATILHTFHVNNCEIWFVRFALNYHQTVLACGNQGGRVFLWDLAAGDLVQGKPVQLVHPKCDALIRHIGFSKCGNVIVTVSEDGTVWRWDRKA
eukprot:m.311376 g.311376  ORF g.311376 m.311376 type:complete len:373 (+) comp67314_c0_seq1:23-1141(+)